MSKQRQLHLGDLSKKSDGGEGGIRTHDRVAPIVVFKTTALVHYATSPSAEEVGFEPT